MNARYIIFMLFLVFIGCKNTNKTQVESDKDEEVVSPTLQTNELAHQWIEVREDNDKRFRVEGEPIVEINGNELHFRPKNKIYEIADFTSENKITLKGEEFYFEISTDKDSVTYWHYVNEENSVLNLRYSFSAMPIEKTHSLKTKNVTLPKEFQNKKWIPIYLYDGEYRASKDGLDDWERVYTFESHINYAEMEDHTYPITKLETKNDAIVVNEIAIRWVDKDREIMQFGGNEKQMNALYISEKEFEKANFELLPKVCSEWLDKLSEKDRIVSNPIDAANIRLGYEKITYNYTIDINNDGLEDLVMVFLSDWSGEDIYTLLAYLKQKDGTYKAVLDSQLILEDRDKSISNIVASEGKIAIEYIHKQTDEKILQEYIYNNETQDWIYRNGDEVVKLSGIHI